jgi:hypothetical protein
MQLIKRGETWMWQYDLRVARQYDEYNNSIEYNEKYKSAEFNWKRRMISKCRRTNVVCRKRRMISKCRHTNVDDQRWSMHVIDSFVRLLNCNKMQTTYPTNLISSREPSKKAGDEFDACMFDVVKWRTHSVK